MDFFVCLLLSFWARSVVSTEFPVVNVTGLGSLRGLVSHLSGDVGLFYRIPYAVPPIGDLRWRPPRPYGPWESPRDARAFGSACVASVAQNDGVVESEDCLFLNVAAPLDVEGRRLAHLLPVMVFLVPTLHPPPSRDSLAV